MPEPKKQRRFLPVIIATLAVVVVLVLAYVGLQSLWPDGPHTETVATYVQPESAAIVEIKPIQLDCRAYVRAEIPVKGESKTVGHYVIFSKTWNTDTLQLNAVGDVDVCVPPEASHITHSENGDAQVEIDASMVVFNRPRVDNLATGISVEYGEGAGRKFLKVLPIASLFSGTNAHEMTLQAEGFAQSIIGSSECMEVAWPAVKDAIASAYISQASATLKPDGSTPNVEVGFVGVPNYAQYAETIDTSPFGDNVSFSVNEAGIECVVASGALQLPTTTISG